MKCLNEMKCKKIIISHSKGLNIIIYNIESNRYLITMMFGRMHYSLNGNTIMGR